MLTLSGVNRSTDTLSAVVGLTALTDFFVGSQSLIFRPSFIFVGTAFSEIRESNRKERKTI